MVIVQIRRWISQDECEYDTYKIYIHNLAYLQDFLKSGSNSGNLRLTEAADAMGRPFDKSTPETREVIAASWIEHNGIKLTLPTFTATDF